MSDISINHENKDRLFTFIFGREQNKTWTLSLYNAINGSDYTDPELIVFNTIKDFLYVGMKNDTSFILSDQLNVYEHQSTYNPNMPLRMMDYAGHVYSGYISKNNYNKYGTTLIRLPVPKLAVFYNGTADAPDETILNLSDSFPEDRRIDADIEVRVRMLNINHGRNKSIMNKCKPLEEYSWLVEKIREYKREDLPDAVDKALNEMPDDYVIRSFLMEHRSEVRGIIDTEYNEAEIKEAFMNDGQAKGETIKLIKQVYSKLRRNKSIEQIADELEESDNISLISDIVDLIKELSPDLDQDENVLSQEVFKNLSGLNHI